MTQQTFLVYNPVTGEISGRCGNTLENAELCLPSGKALLPIEPDSEAAMEYDFHTAFYVAAGEAKRRVKPAITISRATIPGDGATEAMIRGIPEKAVVTISGAVQAGPLPVTGGILRLTSSKAGEITVAFDCLPPHAKWEGKIHVA